MDYQEIIDKLTDEKIKSILEHLQIPYVDRGAYLVMPTYCHNHKDEAASQKLYYYKNNKIFMCYTECGAMSIFKFLKSYYTAQNIEYDWYTNIYELIVDDLYQEGFQQPKYHSLKETYSKSTQTVQLPIYDPHVLECFVKYYTPEWLNDGINKTSMDKYNILYSISQNKIVIPHYDINNNLIGIRGRALNADDIELFGKYMPMQIERKWYSHPLSLNLYGLNYNKENIKKSHVCYIFESEKSVLQLEQFNSPNCAVASCGSNINKFQIKQLVQECAPHEIIVCYDREEHKGEDKYFNKLYAMCKKYSNYANMSFIYDRKGLSKMKDSPSDNGQEIFNILVQERVRV